MKKKFYEKYKSKSNLELEEIIRNEKSYQKEAVSLAKQILSVRKNTSEKIDDQLEKKEQKTKPQKASPQLKYTPEEREKLLALYKKKSTALFVEYFFFSFLATIVFEIYNFNNEQYESIVFLKIFLICFFIYYSAAELLFGRTLIMHAFGIRLSTKNKFSFRFLLYSITSIIDRTFIAPFHMLFALSNDINSFFCEKASGIRWELNKNKSFKKQS